MNNTTTIQEEYQPIFDVSEPIHKHDDGDFTITFNGLPFGLSKEDADKNYPGLWEYVMALIEENPDIITPMPEPEPPPEPEPYEPIPNPLEERIDALEKQVQELEEQVAEIARR